MTRRGRFRRFWGKIKKRYAKWRRDRLTRRAEKQLVRIMEERPSPDPVIEKVMNDLVNADLFWGLKEDLEMTEKLVSKPKPEEPCPECGTMMDMVDSTERDTNAPTSDTYVCGECGYKVDKLRFTRPVLTQNDGEAS